MKRLVAAVMLAAFAAAAAGCTTPNATQPGSIAPQAGAVERPWERGLAVVRAADADLLKGGIRAIRRHVMDLEDVLADADHAFSAARASTDPVYVLTNGPTESVVALAAAQKSGGMPGARVVAVQNPYPLASFFLGTYYNEIGRPQDALRVLDAGLALPAAPMGSDSGQAQQVLLGERGIALAALKRWDDSLASYDRALAIGGQMNEDRGMLLRGRGFALIELNRLDEAEQAYRESLMVDPGNPRALQELTYIARLRAGGPMAPTGIITRPPTPSL